MALFTELFSLIGDPPVQSGTSDSSSNQTKTGVKDPSLPANELLEQGKKSTDPKLALPPGMWPKHTDPLSPHPRPGTHSKTKKGSREDRLPVDHNNEKLRNDRHSNKVIPATGVGPLNRTQGQKASPEIPVQSNNPSSSDSDMNHNSRSRMRSQQTSSNTQRENGNSRMDPEENRPGKSGLNYSRPFSQYNRRSSSLLYHFDIHKKGEKNVS